MRGLLVKDLQLVFSNKTTLPIFVIIAVMLLFTGNSEVTVFMVVAYFTMLCGMTSLSTISYDEIDHSGAFLMTMPVTRKMYVIEKYLFSFLGMLAGWFASFIVGYFFAQVRGYGVSFANLLAGSLTTIMVLFIIICVMIPVQLKFGNEKSRIALVTIGAFVMLIVFWGKSILAALHVDAEAVIVRATTFFTNTSIGLLVGLAIGIFAVAASITVAISFHIMEKKQY